MAEAYTALVSVMHIIDRIQYHRSPPISLDKAQVESLAEKVTFLLEFLEGYAHGGDSNEADPLEMRIADAAYAAEDVIESHIADQILRRSGSHGEEITSDEEIRSIDFYQELRKVIEDMGTIMQEVMEIKVEMGVQDQLQRNSRPADFSRYSSTSQSTMVGFDDVFLELMDKLTSQQPNRQVIPIVGMAGIGKTTLARNIYHNQMIVQHFDILVWVTISQKYKMREILLELLQEVGENLSRINEHELGEVLHRRFSGRRYLIIIDDIWNIEVWDKLKLFFPDNNNGSRIMLTTRLSDLASELAHSGGRIDMPFLDDDNSWKLFSKIVFGEKGCPLELEEYGKKIVQNCKGLPMSIVVIGGLLAKSKHTRDYWEDIAENLNSVVNLKGRNSCLKILYMSYNQLPIYLKPCFLYMGAFPEDSVISVSMLIKLWVAEGFLKPNTGKSLEVVAREYLTELIDRNLIFVHMLGSTGNIKYCSIHDLVRDLCLREAHKERFYNVIGQRSLSFPQGVVSQRRIVIPKGTSEEKILDALQSMSLARSLICNIDQVLPSVNFRLLRILKAFDRYIHSSRCKYFLENMFELVNSRYLEVEAHLDSKFPSSIYLFWNLQSLIVHNYEGVVVAPVEIWNMSQLRHVEFKKLHLPDPPNRNVDEQDYIILENLQTLLTITNFKCAEEVIERILNIKKLVIEYTEIEGWSCGYLNNLDHLYKLESFGCRSHLETFKPSGSDFLQHLTFPYSLKKLTLEASHVHWEDMLERIGSLPFLQKLKLIGGSFRGHKWITIEGEFPNLKFLLIDSCGGLKYWIADSSHFPVLKHLVLRDLHELEEIPSVIGDIPTLQSIQLKCCSNSAIISAKVILEEQQEFGNEGLQIRVEVKEFDDVLQSLASRNFQVEFR